jgi:hypothetical protein
MNTPHPSGASFGDVPVRKHEMTPGPFFGYTTSWNEKMDKSRAFVALIETLQNQLFFVEEIL